MSVTADLILPKDVRKTITISTPNASVSDKVANLKAQVNTFLKEYLEANNVNVADAEKDDVFAEKLSDDEEEEGESARKKRKKK